MKTRMESFLKNGRLEYLIAIIHILFSFLWRSKVFFIEDLPENMRYPRVGDLTDYKLFLVSAFVVSVILVILFWRFVFFVFSSESDKVFKISFFTSCIFFSLCILLMYPSTYALEIDNVTNYMNIVGGGSDYWHHYFTSALYLATFYDFYFPIALNFLQSAAWCGVYAYFISSVFRMTENRWIRILSIVGFFSAYLPYIAMNPYRNCFYTILVFYFFMKLFLIFADKQRLTNAVIVELAFLSGITAFWRSEGKVYLLFLPIMLFCLYGWKEKKRLLILFAASLIVYFVGSFPQSRVEKKVYHNDYMIINVISMLSDTMNNCEWRDYQGSEEDEAAIRALYDPQIIKEYHAMAYQLSNYFNGGSVGVSGASEKQQKDFLHAGFSVIMHNVFGFAKGRTKMVGYALGLLPYYETEKTIELDTGEFYDGAFSITSYGYERLGFWGPIKSSLVNDINDFIWMSVWERYIAIMDIVQSFCWVALLILNIIILVETARQKRWFFASALISIFGMFCAVAVFAPEPREAYYYPVYYQFFMILVFYFAFYADKPELPKSELKGGSRQTEVGQSI